MRLRIPLPKREQPVEQPMLPLYAPPIQEPLPELKQPTKKPNPNVDFRVDLYV